MRHSTVGWLRAKRLLASSKAPHSQQQARCSIRTCCRKLSVYISGGDATALPGAERGPEGHWPSLPPLREPETPHRPHGSE